MNWVKCLISSLGLLLLSQAALAADIQRFTDSQGTLHITNMGPRKRQSQVQPPGDDVSHAASSQRSLSTASAPEPGPVATTLPMEPRVAPTAPAGAGHLTGLQVSHADNTPGVIRPPPGRQEEERPGRAPGALQRVSWTPPPRVPASPGGEIVCYTDRHKVIHVTNLPPAEARPNVPVKATPAVQEQALPQPLEPPGFRRISWQLPETAGPPRMPTPTGEPGPGPVGHTIRSYRDSRGILHITNEPAPQAGPPPTLVAAPAVGKASAATVPAPPVAPAPPETTVQEEALPPRAAFPAVRKVSASELGPEVVAYLEAKLEAASQDLTGQTIRRYRDSRGVWHIVNEPARDTIPWPALAATTVGGVSSAQALAPVIGPVDFPGGPGLARGQPQTQGSKVIARRDHRGVLHVSNLGSPGFMQARGDPASFLNRVPPFLKAIIVEAAQMHGLPVTLVLAIIRNESNFAPLAVSPKGAMGLMQLMPGTAATLGVDDPFAPRENVLAGCRYFRDLLDCFQGSVPLALAAYNAGHQRVISAGCQIPRIKETQNFVTQVMGLYYVLEKQRRLCNLAGLARHS